MPAIADTIAQPSETHLLFFEASLEKIKTPVYMVVDALDECQDRASLLEGVKDMRSWNRGNLHIFVTSRREPEIEDTLRSFVNDIFSLEESVIEGDIAAYIQHQLQHDVKLSNWPKETREEIETTLVNGAKGMFRWVVCQLDAIRGCMKISLLRKALRALPKTLDETYARILGSIPEEHVEDTSRILACLICAFRPLTVEEIAETLAVVFGEESYYDIEDRLQEPRQVLIICSGLVSATEFCRRDVPNGEPRNLEGLRLSHFSVKEYLTSDRIASAQISRFALKERCAHGLLANLCTTYLLWCGHKGLCHDPQERLELSLIPQRSTFAIYAASFWFDHLRSARLDRSTPVYDKCLKMLACPTLLRDIIMLREPRLRYKPEANFLNGFLYERVVRDNGFPTSYLSIGAVSPVFYASLLGLYEIVLMLLDSGEDVNSTGSKLTCLAAATFFGHTKIVRLLLDKGAEVNAVIKLPYDGPDMQVYSPTALQCATEAGREDMVKLLLAEGADVNICRAQPPTSAPSHAIITPLEAAVHKPNLINTRIIRLLLEAGANVDRGGQRRPWELLRSPICLEKLELMSILLNAGVDPNADGRASPLIWAILNGRLQPAILLVGHGADLEGIDSRLIPSLCDLIVDRRLFLSAIEVALKLKPNLNTDMVLIAAAKYGYIDCVKLMLRNRAPPEILDESGVAALHAAAFTPGDDTQIFEMLLDANANVNIPGRYFGSALQAAAMSGKAKVVHMLLEYGASPDYAGGSYGSALEIAQNRLEDLEKRVHHVHKSALLDDYGPDGYFDQNCMLDCETRRLKPVDRAGDDYVPHFEFSHLENANYPAIIDALQSRDAL